MAFARAGGRVGGFGSLVCCSPPSVYMETAAPRLCVWPWSWEEGLCVACLHYDDVFTRLPACAPVARCCYVSKGQNCSLRGTDKLIEQAPFSSSLFGYNAERLFHLCTAYFPSFTASSLPFLSKSVHFL